MPHLRENLSALYAQLNRVLEALWARGYRRFLCGGATGFDTLAAICVRQLRAAHPEAELVLALPCGNQTRGWTVADRSLYDELRRDADRVIILAPHYYPGCMLVRDRFMVDHAAFCVACMEEPTGGTAYTVRYALRQQLPVLNLAIPAEVDHFCDELADLPF